MTDIEGKVQTVLGPVEPADLGVTLTHEHMLIDLRVLYGGPPTCEKGDFYAAPVSIGTLGRIKHQGAPNADNSVLSSVETAIDEVGLFKQHGGGCLVDATSGGIGRDPAGLARISKATGVHIVMGASYYVGVAHPPSVDTMSEDDIFEEIVRDVTAGPEDGIRSGVIGEVGCSWPLEVNERKVLRASARAQRATGAPLLIHPGRDEAAPLQIVDVIVEASGDPSRTIISHIDRTVFLKDTLLALARAGCYLEWDLFGREESHYPANPAIDMPNDAKRMDDIAWLSSQGYGDKIVVAHDICSKHRLVRYGGHGYHYILCHITDRMRARGFTEQAIQGLLNDNPQRALTMAAPQP